MCVESQAVDYSLLRHICNGVLLNHDRESTLILAMNYSVYFDDGGHPDDKPCVIAAGFLATEQQWLDFEPAWKKVLRDHKLGDVFHMTDFEKAHRNNPVKWDILHDLISVILAHTKAGFNVYVDMADYRRVNAEFPLQECIGTPFGIAARSVVRNINIWKAKIRFNPKDDHLLVFVEDGTKHRGDMEEAFRRDGIPVPQPVPKSTPALQPADMLAWEALFTYRRQYIRKTLRRIITESQHFIEGRYGAEHMLKGMKDLGIPKRSDIAPNAEFVFHSLPKRKRRRTIK